ncbi:MAG: DUF1376 domain-containing protein [Bradyrhizobium sp.]|jgi:hypothetical protein|nr:DUF1376 domain-containing protein [Bradyrhizobium sp.]
MTDLPDPLTGADCDLQDFPFMPLQVARLRDSDLAATEEPEACWYAVLLWAASWHQVPAASLPDDDLVLTRMCGLGRDIKTFRKYRGGALRGFVKCSDGRLYHPVVAEQANRSWSEKAGYRERKAQRIAAARTAAAARWSPQPQSDSDAERNASGNANRMRDASEPDAQRIETAMPKGTGTGTGTPPNPHQSDHRDQCQRIADEAGMLGIPPDHRLLREWLALPDMELERDILPVVRRVTAEIRQRDNRAPFKFKLFDAAIREQHARDEAEIGRLRAIAGGKQ